MQKYATRGQDGIDNNLRADDPPTGRSLQASAT
jgi:hypothetical protein